MMLGVSSLVTLAAHASAVLKLELLFLETNSLSSIRGRMPFFGPFFPFDIDRETVRESGEYPSRHPHITVVGRYASKFYE